MALSLPNSCCCMSLRAASIIIGTVILGLSSLYLVNSLVRGIVFLHSIDLKYDEIYHHMIMMISFEYLASAHIVFSTFLLYGCIQEVSCFTLSWLFCEIGIYLTMVLNVILTLPRFFFYLEDLILLILLGGSIFIVYCYYDNMKKPEAV